MRWFVFLGSGTFTVIALAQAIYAGLVTNGPKPRDVALVTAVSIASVWLAAFVIRRRVSTANFDGDEREYMCAAWLCIGFGVVLMLVEGALELTDSPVQFLFEDPLLGIGAVYALMEEVRLFKRSLG